MKMASIFRSFFSHRVITRINLTRQLSLSSRYFKEETLDDGPIKFSKSLAIKYKAKTSRTGESDPRLWYEPHVLYGSIAVFLLYFCVLREENDLDIELGSSLYSRLQGLEEFQLRQSLKFNLEHGIDTKEIERRLKEIEKESEHSES